MRKVFALLLLVNFIGVSQIEEPKRIDVISSPEDEVAPLLTGNGEFLYFMRIDHSENYFGEDNSQDVWVTEKNPDGSWSTPVRVEAEFNKARNKALVWASEDGSRFYITGLYTKTGKWRGRGLSEVLNLGEGRWGIPEAVPIKGFGKLNKGKTCNVNVSSDDQMMLLAFSKKWGKTSNDLFISMKKKGKWKRPSRIKKNLNKFKSIDAPYFSVEDSVIYFSGRSKFFGCADKPDLFKIKVLDSDFKNFGEPERLEDGINSESYDSYYSSYPTGESFLVSDRVEGGGADIYLVNDTVSTVQEEEPIDELSTVSVAGFILDRNTGERVPTDSVIGIMINGELIDSIAYNAESGFLVVLPTDADQEIALDSKVNGYSSNDTLLTLENISGGDSINLDLLVSKKKIVDKDHFEEMSASDFEVGQVFSLNHVYFVLSKVELLPESEPELNVLAELLKDNPNVRIQIEGHTDYGGVESQNLQLSEERARSVGEYLIEQGIDKKRLEYKGYGSSRRLVKSQVQEERVKNRRVEFRVIEIVVPKENRR